jgi:hypothetical protein
MSMARRRFQFAINEQFVRKFHSIIGSFLLPGIFLDKANFRTDVETTIFLNRMPSQQSSLSLTLHERLPNLLNPIHTKTPLEGHALATKQKSDIILTHLIDGCPRMGNPTMGRCSNTLSKIDLRCGWHAEHHD